MNYDIDYFITKFESIPEEKWCKRQFSSSDGQHCALGHCGVTVWRVATFESEALAEIFGGRLRIIDINDNSINPREAILDALRDLKESD